jgi:hypothetical protein
MKHPSLAELTARQQVLQARAAQERSDFSLHFEPLEKPLSWADKGVDAFHFISSNPFLWSSAFAVLAHYRPKLATKALAVGWGAMKLFKTAKNII